MPARHYRHCGGTVGLASHSTRVFKVPVYSPLAERGCGRETGCALGGLSTQCVFPRECPSCRPHLAAVAEAPRSHTSGGSCDIGRSLFWVCITVSKVLGVQLPIGWWALVLCSQWCLPEREFAMPQGTLLGPRARWGLGVIREVGTPGSRGAGTLSGPKLDPKTT